MVVVSDYRGYRLEIVAQRRLTSPISSPVRFGILADLLYRCYMARHIPEKAKAPKALSSGAFRWLRGLDLNQRPLGYEPNELPGCSTPR